jgi:hypothetical protein
MFGGGGAARAVEPLSGVVIEPQMARQDIESGSARRTAGNSVTA